MQSNPTTRASIENETYLPYLRRRLIEALERCDRLALENQMLRKKLKIAQTALSSKDKLRVCREIKRRTWLTGPHMCGVSLPKMVHLQLAQEPCRTLTDVGVGAIILERCEYLRLEQSFTRTEDGCWLWTGSKNRLGYGIFNWDGQTWQAHRFTYTLYAGAIPFGLTIDHLCRQRECVRPDHLEAVTLGENVRRKPGVLRVP